MVLPVPRGAKLLKILNPNTHGRDRMIISTMLKRTARLRVQPQRSIPNETIFSNTAMIVDSAANDMNTKNNAPNSRPAGIALKILGSVTNTNPGP